MVIYFYGGGFTQGHGTADLYNPYHLVEQEDIIVITFNYRLGALGYLDWSYFNNHYDYNNGMSDQINLLKWVHDHIAYFGGNPQNITLMGQSAKYEHNGTHANTRIRPVLSQSDVAQWHIT